MTARFSRRQAIQLGAVALATPAILSPGRAFAQEATLRLGHVLAPTHPFHLGFELAAKTLAESTGGRVKLEIFPSSQLGTERDTHVSIRTGGVDMVLGSPGGSSVHLKEVAINDAPYIYRDNAHWQAVVYGEIGEDWNRRMVEQSGVRITGWFHRGTRHIVSRTGAYETLAAVQGQKIRVADIPPYPQVIQSFGAIPTPIAFAEMYQALESGIVDGADAPLDTVVSQKLFEVSKFVNLIAWSFAAPGPILISEQAWSQLKTDDQAALVAAIRAGSDYVTETLTAGDEAMKQQLVDAGMTMSTPTDLPAWEAAAAAAIPTLADSWGGDVSLYQKIRDVQA